MRYTRRTTMIGRALRAALLALLILALLALALTATGTSPTELWHYLRDGPSAPNPLQPDL